MTYVITGGKFNMSDGSIYANRATNSGGAIANQGGEVNISGGRVYSNRAFSGNDEAKLGGGAIAAWGGGTTTLSGSAMIYDNTAGNGGAIKVSNATVVFNGAEIGRNTATYSSGTSGVLGGSSTITYTGGRFHTLNTYSPAISGMSTITFNKNGGTGGTDSIEQAWNAGLQSVTAPTRSGYTFLGYFNEAGERYYSADGAAFEKPGTTDEPLENGCAYYGNGIKWDYIGPVTLCAKWAKETHTHADEAVAFEEPISDLAELNALIANGGSGYLTADIEVPTNIVLLSGDVKLDLNGKTISFSSASTGYSAIELQNGCNFDLYDCKNTGTIQKTGTGCDRAVRVYANSTFRMHGGTITGFQNNAQYLWGGAVDVTDLHKSDAEHWDGVFNLTGGKITGNYAKEAGGGVAVDNKTTFTMTGGEISGNTTDGSGGVYVYQRAEDKIGTVTLGGTAKITGNVKGGTITDGALSGGTANNAYLPTALTLITPGTAAAGMSVGVTLSTENGLGTFTTNTATAAYGDYFFSDAGYGVMYDSVGTALKLIPAHVHGAGTGAITFEKPIIDSEGLQRLFTNGGSGYLMANITATGYYTIKKDVKLDLNGKTISFTGTNTQHSAIVINEGDETNYSFDLYDCKDCGKIENKSTNTTDYLRAVYVGKTRTFNLYGGTITGFQNNTKGQFGGAVFVEGDAAMNLYGGKITDCYGWFGGAVGVQGTNGKLVMSGGTIENCSASSGGAILVEDGTVEVTGGKIVHNRVSTGLGGGIVVCNNSGTATGTLTVTGGEIAYNCADRGGAIGTWGSVDVTVSGTANIYHNTAANFGGAVGIKEKNGNLTLDGTANIHDNTAAIYGGAVGNEGTGTVTLGGKVTVTGNVVGGTISDAGVLSGGTANNLYLAADKTVTLNTPETGMNVGVTMASGTGTFIANTAKAAIADYFISDAGYGVKFDPTGTALKLAAAHTHDNITFKPWNYSDKLPDKAGNWYLTQNMTLSGKWTVPASTVNLCLNGKVVKQGTANTRVINVPSGATLNVYDCDTQTVHKFAVDGTTGLWTLNETSGTKTVTGGIVTGGIVTGGTGTNGGAVLVNGTFHMCSGTIIGCTASSGGGGVCAAGTFNMSGGAICYCIGGNSFGGGIGIGGGSFTMTGGTIENCAVVDYPGGGIGFYKNNDQDAGNFTMTGGTVKNNTAKKPAAVSILTPAPAVPSPSAGRLLSPATR